MAEKISFHLSLYLPDAVQAAAAAFAEHAKVEVIPSDDSVLAEISALDQEDDPRLIANTFCNYVLHETILRKRQETA
jgi:hypothetical protein